MIASNFRKFRKKSGFLVGFSSVVSDIVKSPWWLKLRETFFLSKVTNCFEAVSRPGHGRCGLGHYLSGCINAEF
jgi:hypothetical protein